jgi:hypothetical protein
MRAAFFIMETPYSFIITKKIPEFQGLVKLLGSMGNKPEGKASCSRRI